MNNYRLPANTDRRARWRALGFPIALIPVLILGASAAYSFIAPVERHAAPALPTKSLLEGPLVSVALSLPERIHTAEQDVEPDAGNEDLAAVEDDPLAGNAVVPRWIEHTIRPRESLSSIFSQHRLSAATLHRILAAGDDAKRLARINSGQQLKFGLNGEGKIEQLIYEIDPTRSLYASRMGDGFEAELRERPVEVRSTRATGVIVDSLFTAGQKAGFSDAMTLELANLFAWDIDFAQDIRAGDRFTVIYEENFLDGSRISEGAILAAEFINQGQKHRVLRYVDQKGKASYYTPDGRSVKKAFLRTPVEFTRISSYFSLGRKHPILNRIRAHKGVDYAAPRGTPVRAAGDGKISFRGQKGGYGNVIVIDHGGGISTLYGHLSRYASSSKGGRKVRQGEVIGYVGMTGLATGPHLHYEFRVKNVHRNPLKVTLPAAAPIEARYRADFERQSEPLLAQLDLLDRTLVAKAE